MIAKLTHIRSADAMNGTDSLGLVARFTQTQVLDPNDQGLCLYE